eukprot:COSAG02_NODE_43796_length_371_cov_1.330882_1_plen_41_part_10
MTGEVPGASASASKSNFTFHLFSRKLYPLDHHPRKSSGRAF